MSTWQDLVTASLIGTERAVVPPAGTTGLLPAVDETGDPAAVLLDRAALLTAARRAGRRPGHAEPLPACEPDPRPMVSPAAVARLARILSREPSSLLIEWLRAVTARGLRLPPQFLPALLDRARRPREWRLPNLIAEAGGPRASWLAGLNPDWDFVLAATRTGDEAWRLGTPGQRRAYLTALRARDPSAARELIAGSWAAAGPQERGLFVNALADGLSLADEPLLEAALEDGTDWVGTMAAGVLATLPGSAFSRRMTGRAVRCVRIEHGARGTRLVITPPQVADRTRLVLDVVARTLLRTWTDEFGLTAAQIVALPAGDWAPALFIGWSRAAVAQRDHDWMAALIHHVLTGRLSGRPAEIEALRELVRAADPALNAPDALPPLQPDAPPVIGSALNVLRFRYEMLKELDDDHSG
jgi:Family of unknown function (DUF5691)